MYIEKPKEPLIWNGGGSFLPFLVGTNLNGQVSLPLARRIIPQVLLE
jgi:hypothetical protein